MAQTEPATVGGENLLIHNLVRFDPHAGFAEDVRRGLSASPKSLSPKYFYDELGSQLFDAICLLPEYYLTRAENEIIERYAAEIVNSVAGDKTLLEMGSGSASKTRLIIDCSCKIDLKPLISDTKCCCTDCQYQAIVKGVRACLQRSWLHQC